MSESTSTQRPGSRSSRFGVGAVVAVAALGVGGLGLAGAMPTVGSVSADEAEVYVSMSPVRVLDTRDPGGVPFGADESRTLNLSDQVPGEATAVVINTTVDRATGPTYITIWPTGETRPYTSVNNPELGIITPNTTIARLGANTSIDIYNFEQQVDVIVDLAGYFVPVSEVEGFGGSSGTIDGSAGTIDGSGEAVLGNTTFTTAATFTAPVDGNFVLNASVDVQFATPEMVAAGAAGTAVCRWNDGRDIERGASVTEGILIGLDQIPGVNRAHIGVPGAGEDMTAGDTITLDCRTDTLLAVGSQLQVDVAFTVIQVATLN